MSHNFKTILETERLILRPHTLDDVDAAYKLNLDEEVTRYTGDGGVVSKEEIRHRIEHHVLGDYKKYSYGRFAVVEKSSGDFIGFCGLKYLPEYDLVDLGYRLSRNHWGKGLATEASKASVDFAFNELKLSEIYGFVLPENSASVNVLKKLGFQFDIEMIEDNETLHRYRLEKS